LAALRADEEVAQACSAGSGASDPLLATPLPRVSAALIDFRDELSLGAALKRLRRAGCLRLAAEGAVRLSARAFHRLLCLASLRHTGSLEGVESEESEESEEGGGERLTGAERRAEGWAGGVDSEEVSGDVDGWTEVRAARHRRGALGRAGEEEEEEEGGLIKDRNVRAGRAAERKAWNGWGECWGLRVEDVGEVDYVADAQEMQYALADDDGKQFLQDACEMAGRFRSLCVEMYGGYYCLERGRDSERCGKLL